MATGQAIALIASAIGSAIQGKGAKKAAAANIAGQKEAAAYAMEGSMPWDVSGSLGGAKFDSEGKAISLSLSPEFKTQQEAYLASATANRGWLGDIEGSPEDAAQRFYEQEMALVKPEQAVARGELDAQLYAQGMLGGTGGAARAAALAQAQGNVRLQSRQSASDRVQGMIDKYRARITGDVTGATDLGQLPLKYAELGIAQGEALRPAAIEGGKYLSGAATAAAKGMMGKYQGYGDAARSFINYKGANTGTGGYTSNRRTAAKASASPLTVAGADATDTQFARNQAPGYSTRRRAII
jgi:hypothetical protein